MSRRSTTRSANIPAEQTRMHCAGVITKARTTMTWLSRIFLHRFRRASKRRSHRGRNPRDAHEWAVFERMKLPEGKVLNSRSDRASNPISLNIRISSRNGSGVTRAVGRENVLREANLLRHLGGSGCGSRPRRRVGQARRARWKGAVASRQLWNLSRYRENRCRSRTARNRGKRRDRSRCRESHDLEISSAAEPAAIAPASVGKRAPRHPCLSDDLGARVTKNAQGLRGGNAKPDYIWDAERTSRQTPPRFGYVLSSPGATSMKSWAGLSRCTEGTSVNTTARPGIHSSDAERQARPTFNGR